MSNIQISIKTCFGKKIPLQVSLSESIESVKDKLCEKEGIGGRLALTFAGKRLEGSRTLADYGVQNESIIHLSIPMR